MTSEAVDARLAGLYRDHAGALVRMARLFVDDRNAAEDIVQEAFLRLRRSLRRVDDSAKAPAYLRSIVLNLARDHNRHGLMSLRHRTPPPDDDNRVDEGLLLEERQREVVEALRRLPARQRDCIVLRYYLELAPPDIADTLGLSVNSVKTHLKRGLVALERRLGEEQES